jgi:fatty-acyl-CoA synthase
MRKLSYISGTSDKPLIGQTIGVFFDHIVEKYPDNLAVISRHQNIRWTYEKLQIEVNRCAKGFRAINIEKGDRVGIWANNCVEWLVVQIATAKLGAILVNINPGYRTNELEYSLNHTQIKALVIADNFKTSDYAQMIYELAPELYENDDAFFESKNLPNLKTVISLAPKNLQGIVMWDEFMDMGSEINLNEVLEIQRNLSFDEPINIQFTSGTSGRPKGATLSHHNILNNADIITTLQNLNHTDKIVIPVPLYHCFGMVLGNLGCITKGATMIYTSESFDPELVLKAAEEEKATSLYGVPTMFFAELNHPELST